MTLASTSDSDLDLYQRRRTEALGTVAWWMQSAGPAFSIVPLEIERLGRSPTVSTEGPLSTPPSSLGQEEYAYGFDPEGRIRVQFRGTSFPDKHYETFVLDEAGIGARLSYYSYSADKPLISETAVSYDDAGRVAETLITYATRTTTETYVYDDDRLVEIAFADVPSGDESTAGKFVAEYDGGTLSALHQRYANGYERTVYTQKRKASISHHRTLVEESLLRAVPPAVRRGSAPEIPIVGIALAYSAAGPMLPPLVGVLTEPERDALLDRSATAWGWWNPAEYDVFDQPALDLDLSPDATAACDRLNEGASSGQIREVLNRVAHRLNEMDWHDVLGSTPVVYATDLEGAEIWENLATALSSERLQALSDAGLLPR